MSTRAGIIVKDKYSKDGIHFYRHSDGYPEGALPLLKEFMLNVKNQVYRNNVSQSAGWLIALGMREYGNMFAEWGKTPDQTGLYWKVGSIEPTTNVNRHGDLEYIYVLNLDKLTIEVFEVDHDWEKETQIEKLIDTITI